LASTGRTSGGPDALEVFAAVRQLCRFDGGEDEFWRAYARLMAELCHSPVTLILNVDDQTWQAVEFYCQDSANESLQDDLVSQTLALYKRMEDRLFIVEPLRLKGFEIPAPFLIVSKAERPAGGPSILIAVIADHADPDRFNEIVVRTQLVSTVYFAYRHYAGSRDAGGSDNRLSYALELLDEVIGQKKFVIACMTLVNELSTQFDLSKVSIGWKGQNYLKTVAVSHLETFDKNSSAISDLEALFEEAADQEKEIVLPGSSDDKITITHNHDLYKSAKNLDQLVTISVYVDTMVVAAVTMERVNGRLSDADITLISIAINQAGPWLQELHHRDLWPGAKIYNAVKSHLSWWLGPQHTWAKFLIVSLLVLMVFMSVKTMNSRLESTASLETDNVAYLSAPYNGFIAEINVHAGDRVRQGQVLVNLDTEELVLKELEEEANVERFSREAEKARSDRALADMKVALSRVKQAETELKRIRYYLAQARISAPFDGIVVDGDKLELQGAPVSKGDLLLKVANPTDLYVKIKLDERDIDFVKSGARGELKLLSQPDAFHEVTIDKIIPVAQADPGNGNIFEIRAELNDIPATWWRPGMSGVVYVHVGRRPIIRVLLRRTIDAIRMKLWF